MKNPNSNKKSAVAQSGKSQEISNECLPLDGSKGEIVLYQPSDDICLEVRFNTETVWLNRQQMAILFGRDVKTIGKHVNNALKEELKEMSTVAKFATVQNEGGRLINREIEFYSLDMVLSVGYRVKSDRGIAFRQWANGVLKQYLLKGYVVNARIVALEHQVAEQNVQLKDLSNKVDFFVKSSLPPQQGIFFEGQVFDAYRFASDLIRKATHSIVLIDNYVDDSVLAILDKRQKGVSATIYTQRISQQLQLDIDKHNVQYPAIKVEPFNKAHDRFLLIDDEVYHIGASIKDLGKKWFAFTCLKDIKAGELIQKIQ